MTACIGGLVRATILALAATASLAAGVSGVDAGVRHRHRATQPADAVQQRLPPQPRGVAGYFGPGAYGPFGSGPLGPFSPGGYGYGYGYGYGPPRGDLGFALLGALNGGGFRGFVECGNYYARYPGACGF